jgi:hypothetical protein
MCLAAFEFVLEGLFDIAPGSVQTGPFVNGLQQILLEVIGDPQDQGIVRWRRKVFVAEAQLLNQGAGTRLRH